MGNRSCAKYCLPQHATVRPLQRRDIQGSMWFGRRLCSCFSHYSLDWRRELMRHTCQQCCITSNLAVLLVLWEDAPVWHISSLGGRAIPFFMSILMLCSQQQWVALTLNTEKMAFATQQQWTWKLSETSQLSRVSLLSRLTPHSPWPFTARVKRTLQSWSGVCNTSILSI